MMGANHPSFSGRQRGCLDEEKFAGSILTVDSRFCYTSNDRINLITQVNSLLIGGFYSREMEAF
jgi:hypothetical protein